nr:ATP synthase subunit I [Lachnospiraceae bacterium]
MRKKLTQLSDVLPELWAGILLYGVLCEIVGLIFVKERLFYSIGLITGIVCALFMATHMAWSLNQALDMAEGDAVKKMQVHNILRYVVVVIVFFLLLYSKLGNPLAAFLGVMGLKVAAYLQPFTHKFFRR